MAQYNDDSVYSLITALLAADRVLVHKDSDNAEHLITFADIMASIEALLPPPAYGGSAGRPTTPPTGTQYFDTDLGTTGMPIWWDSAQWVDATGTPV
jgi:hypothetical protein